MPDDETPQTPEDKDSTTSSGDDVQVKSEAGSKQPSSARFGNPTRASGDTRRAQ